MRFVNEQGYSREFPRVLAWTGHKILHYRRLTQLQGRRGVEFISIYGFLLWEFHGQHPLLQGSYQRLPHHHRHKKMSRNFGTCEPIYYHQVCRM